MKDVTVMVTIKAGATEMERRKTDVSRGNVRYSKYTGTNNRAMSFFQ